MPLDHGYGVAIGTFASFTREDPSDFGHWYHGKLRIDTPSGQYEAPARCQLWPREASSWPHEQLWPHEQAVVAPRGVIFGPLGRRFPQAAEEADSRTC